RDQLMRHFQQGCNDLGIPKDIVVLVPKTKTAKVADVITKPGKIAVRSDFACRAPPFGADTAESCAFQIVVNDILRHEYEELQSGSHQQACQASYAYFAGHPQQLSQFLKAVDKFSLRLEKDYRLGLLKVELALKGRSLPVRQHRATPLEVVANPNRYSLLSRQLAFRTLGANPSSQAIVALAEALGDYATAEAANSALVSIAAKAERERPDLTGFVVDTLNEVLNSEGYASKVAVEALSEIGTNQAVSYLFRALSV
ncbi:unnamed protein product, partial [marine sediment metagenome]